MGRHNDNFPNVREKWTDTRSAFRQHPRHFVHEHSVYPALHDGGLTRPPGGIHQNQRLGPLNILNMNPQIGEILQFQFNVSDMIQPLIRTKHRVELLCVQIMMANLMIHVS
jgi:hypothetical protein